MNRGEVKFNIIFDGHVNIDASYITSFNDWNDESELQDVLVDLLFGLIDGKEDKFLRAEAVVKIQGESDYYCATFDNMEGPKEWKQVHMTEGTIH
tara:strand:- start:751 stop:1035 length:285 start_codon:yes stop_codon:yes gene_type:complete